MNTNVFIFFSLLFDLLAFTIILPLLPSTLECYSKNDSSGLYYSLQNLIISGQRLMGSPETFNRALFGGILGSWFSLLQFITMPIVGSLSDVYGRRLLYLICLMGISISYVLWIVSANYFSIFVLFRTVGGLSKGNISLSTAIVTDSSTEEKRGKGFALIGIAFSVGFIIGPLLGAFMSKWNSSSDSCFQPYPPLIALLLSLVNIVFSYLFLSETLPASRRSNSVGSGLRDALDYINPWSLFSFNVVQNINLKEKQLLQLGGIIYFLFLFVHSGLEFTLTFLTYIRFNFSNIDQGKVFFFVGLQMFLIQGLFVRRVSITKYSGILISGIILAIFAFITIGFSYTTTTLSIGLCLYAYPSATVVPTLSTLVSTCGPSNQKGTVLGVFRSIGALARAVGPISTSFLFWKYGIEASYLIGSLLFLIPLYLSLKLNTLCSSHKLFVK